VKTHQIGERLFAPILGILALCLGPQNLLAQNAFVETDLVSDISGRAKFTDPNLVNPWGIAFSATSPFWIADNGNGLSTLYNTSGTPQALVVSIPLPTGAPSAPTGQVFNGGTAFNADRFIFATENGTINGWRGTLGTTAETLFNRSTANSVYKGLAISNVGTSTYLYAADFHNNHVDIFPSAAAPALSGSFVDPTLPSGYAPFNIQNLGGQLYVTYAKQDAQAHDEIAGAGNGYVSVFDLNGNFVRRLASGGALDAPWGVAIAPAGFGSFGGDLLVGNFGDGIINAYNLATGAWIDTLRGFGGVPLEIDGLWGLAFGNGGSGGRTDTLYFTAGIDDEAHGLFGSIAPVPEPSTVFAGLALIGLCVAAGLKRLRPVSSMA
jgi:uncharacterized protein (TIGR03118 family)